jgi:hypothetical protein
MLGYVICGSGERGGKTKQKIKLKLEIMHIHEEYDVGK